MSQISIHGCNIRLFSRVWLISIILLFLLPQNALSKDLLYYYKLAQKNDAAFQAATHAYEASRQIKRQAIANLLPSLNADAEQTYTYQDIKNSDSFLYREGQTHYDRTSLSLNLKQPIFNYAFFVRVRQAGEEEKVADAEFEASRQDLMVRVVEAYLKCLITLDAIRTVMIERDAVQAFYALTREKYDRGLAGVTDMYDAEARLNLAKAKLIEAKNLKEDAFEALTEITKETNIEVMPFKKIIPVKPHPDSVDSWVEAALKQNIRLSLQRHKVAVAEEEVKKQYAANYPVVDFTGNVRHHESSGTEFGGGFKANYWEAGIRFSLPLVQGGLVLSKIKEAQARYREAISMLDKEKRRVVRETRAAFLNVKTSIDKIRALEAYRKSQEAALQLKQEGYETGLYESVEVLDAQRELTRATMEYYKACYEYVLNNIKLKQSAGILSDEDIIMVNNCLRHQ